MLKDRLPTRIVAFFSAPSALAGALLAMCLYAAFAHGAVASGDEERLQLAVAAVAAVSAVAWLWSGALVLRAPRAGWIALALLMAFAFWSGATLLWSVSPDQTWIECNRVLTYALVLGLAICLGCSHPRAVRLVSAAFALIAVLVSAYALAQKLAPGVRVAGLLNLDRTGSLPRLQDPLGYWNALGVFVGMGIAPLLALVLDSRQRPRLRLGGATTVVAMLVTIAFTYSRGALLAVAAAAAVVALGGPSRLRALMWTAICVAAAAPAALVGLASAPLTVAGAGLAARERAGVELLVVLVASGLLLALGGRRLIALELRVTLAPARRSAILRGLTAAGVSLVLAVILALALSGRGLSGSVSHAWHSFTATRAVGVSDPRRLLSADSENRWAWWKEAAGAIGARPLQGWGAGSFGVTHLLFRRDTLSVQQPHSVPLQFLAETGIVGAVLALGCLATLLATAARAVRRAAGHASPAAVGLLGAAVAYAVHSLYDWDWDIPALTIAFLVLAGTLVGSLTTRPVQLARPSRPLWRGVACAAAAGCLAVFAVSVITPRLAASDAGGALLLASETSRPSLSSALARALASSRLDPISDAGLRVAATIALRRDEPRLARRLLVSAVRRQPTDGQAWQQLGFVYLLLGDARDALTAARRGLALDPRGPVPIAMAQRAVLASAPPTRSATAAPTPGGGVQRRLRGGG